jgi:hypothetical protein
MYAAVSPVTRLAPLDPEALAASIVVARSRIASHIQPSTLSAMFSPLDERVIRLTTASRSGCG